MSPAHSSDRSPCQHALRYRNPTASRLPTLPVTRSLLFPGTKQIGITNTREVVRLGAECGRAYCVIRVINMAVGTIISRLSMESWGQAYSTGRYSIWFWLNDQLRCPTHGRSVMNTTHKKHTQQHSYYYGRNALSIADHFGAIIQACPPAVLITA